MSYQYNKGGFATWSPDGKSFKRAVVCKLEPGAKLPERAHPTDAGADMFALLGEGAPSIVIAPGEQKTVDTGVAVKVPEGYGGFLHARSSQRSKSITCWGTGIIDSEYRGTILVVISNQGTKDYVVDRETKIAQLVIQAVELVGFIDGWNDTERGTGGFGSTGK